MSASLDTYFAGARPSGQYVSTTGTSGVAARIEGGATRLAENFETFLTLLTAQLKNQDPLSPMDGNQFTQQLVQMSSVEQQLLSNDLLKTLVANTSGQTGGFGDPVGMIGRVVTAESSEAALTADGAAWQYEIPKAAVTTTLEIKDALGQVVWSGTPPVLGAGRHEFNGDGVKSDGEQAAEGVYTLSVKAVDGEGRAMLGRSFVEGTVTGVELFNGETLLTLGKSQVWLDAVSAVRSAG